MTFQYSITSRGFVVHRLQQALNLPADGIYGPQTSRAVQRLQNGAVTSTGEAGPAEFAAAGILWPTDFERCMNMVSNFEGTGFGDCNATDIDGAGLTLGIAGLTTRHGEVQPLLARYLAEKPSAIDALPLAIQRNLAALLTRPRPADPDQWRRLFYGRRNRVDPAWQAAFAAWGSCPVMQNLQLHLARERFWLPAVQAAESLGFSTLQAKCFFLDVAVQNGGWRKAHHTVASQMTDWQSEDQTRALTVAARAIAACARETWRNDVLSRKMTLARGHGNVHGKQWNLQAHAITPTACVSEALGIGGGIDPEG